MDLDEFETLDRLAPAFEAGLLLSEREGLTYRFQHETLRESIYDGSFRYCRHDRCPLIKSGSLGSLEDAGSNHFFGQAVKERRTTLDALPQFVNLVSDRSCNLYCPSCRTHRIIRPAASRW